MSTAHPIPPIAPSSALVQVTDEELARYAAMIYERTGVHISPRKQMLLSNRLRRRLRETGIASFGEYYRHLRAIPPTDPEWDAFLQEITTHETYLFRDEVQWTWFRHEYLPARPPEGPPNDSLRVWSAACSTGDEALTAACCIAACLPGFRQRTIAILGTDIGVEAVRQARTAVFGERAMRLVPAEYRRAYFTEVPNGRAWRAKPVLVEMTAFRQHNLVEALRERPFDVVFLKNVLIYFDQASKQRVLANVLPLVRPGGLLVVGASEGLGDLLKGFLRIQPWLYRRPEDKRERR